MQLIDELRDEHDLIDAAAAAFRGFAATPVGPETADAGRAFVRFFRVYAGDYHHAREEDVLFPALVERLELPADRGPLAVLSADHRRMSALLAAVAHLLDGNLESPGVRTALREAIELYTESLAHHIDAENSVLLPESEGRLLKRNIRELPSRPPTAAEAAARDLAHDLIRRYPSRGGDAIMRGDGCVLCPAMGESCAGLEREWWNDWEWEEFEDHLPGA